MSVFSRRTLTAVAAVAGLGVLAACGTSDPMGTSPATTDPGAATGDTTLVVGSQAYYSNEIIAEIYAQALEGAGYTVEREYQIGQREVYLPELEAGDLDVMPEYGGNLLQYYNSDAEVTDTASIVEALGQELPDGLRVLTPAEASDQDSYTVTRAFADEHNLTAIGDLAGINGLTIAANSEFATRPYGPDGVQQAYGVTIALTPVEDSGGPLTLRALLDGTTQVADLYTADPAIADNDLVVLDDPESLILPQNVLPLVSERVDAEAEAVLDDVNAQLSASDLQELNAQSVNEQRRSADIASEWLAAKGLA
ncbi:ABC transporter substrate-binding protein [Propioniciclava soli]|uniref:ABC transporter substrate-binding protein n=1 Tax=Propioniciclava soli TaxID=2775081 RepID=UPI001E457569|nr:ABC transporter substrate-binding protein [Propioniciclava soli]